MASNNSNFESGSESNEFDQYEYLPVHDSPCASESDCNEYDQYACDFKTSSIPDKEVWYLYHLYDILPEHFKTFTSLYKKEIIAVALHCTNDDFDCGVDGTYKDKDGVMVIKQLNCPKYPHYHIGLDTSKPLSECRGTDQVTSKWFGFRGYDKKLIAVNGKEYTAGMLWKEKYGKQLPYKYGKIQSESYYNNWVKYMQKILLKPQNKGTIEKLLTYTPNKGYYTKLDPCWKERSLSIQENTTPILDQELKISTHDEIDDIIHKISRQHQSIMNSQHKAYNVYKRLFLDNNCYSIKEWEIKEGHGATAPIIKAFSDGKEAEEYFSRSPISEADRKWLEENFPLTTATIRFLLFNIGVKKYEKDVFLILEGLPSCGKTTMGKSIADAYGPRQDCDMKAFIGDDNLGMEYLATKQRTSIMCDDLKFTNKDHYARRDVQDHAKKYLCSTDFHQRTNKSNGRDKKSPELARVHIIVVLKNDEKVESVDDVSIFLEDDGLRERTIRIHYGEIYAKHFKKERKTPTQVPYMKFSQYACWTYGKFIDLIRKEPEAVDIDELYEFVKPSWYINDLLKISYQSDHARIICNKLEESYGFSKINYNEVNMKINLYQETNIPTKFPINATESDN